MYLGTARLGLRFVWATAWFDLAVVLPCNLAGHYAGGSAALGAAASSDLDRFTMAHTPPGSPLLWAHAASVVWKTGCVLLLLERRSAWLAAQQLRARRAQLVLNTPAVRTVLVTQIPAAAAGPGGGAGVCAAGATLGAWLGGGPGGGGGGAPGCGSGLVERCTPVCADAALAPLAAERARLARRLAGKRGREARGRAAAAGGPAAPPPPPRARPRCGGDRGVDAALLAEELLGELDARLGALRRAALAQPPEAALAAGLLRPRAAFVTFRDARTASVAGQAAQACDPAAWRVAPAAEPGNVVWPNVGRYDASAAAALAAAGWGVAVVLCFLYIPPAVAIQARAPEAARRRGLSGRPRPPPPSADVSPRP